MVVAFNASATLSASSPETIISILDSDFALLKGTEFFAAILIPQ
jgi:hypothetical protein